MPLIFKKPLIVIYGSYSRTPVRQCDKQLLKIIAEGNKDTRLKNIDINVVANLPYKNLPAITSIAYNDWVREKTNHYLKESDFNAIFILKRCDNSTPHREAFFALQNGLESKTIIFLEKEKGGGENTAGLPYFKSEWNKLFQNPPIAYIDYGDFKTSWRKIMTNFLSLYET